MKSSRDEIHRKTYTLPALSFEDQQLTSFSGLVIFQALFTRLQLKRRLSGCFAHLHVTPIFGHGVMVLLLIVHLLLGCWATGNCVISATTRMIRWCAGSWGLPGCRMPRH